MNPSKKYDTSGLIEAQYEPGSRGRVLRNKLGIKSKRLMERAESEPLFRAIAMLAGMYGKRYRFRERDVRKIHKIWLGDIYEWAGKYRQTNMSKDGFPFTPPLNIPRLMEELEKVQLKELTPCNFKTINETARAIATVHVELVLIHPFREGNGRAARLLADLMAMQADLPPLDYSLLDKRKWQDYIRAIHAGIGNDYRPMTELFIGIIDRTLKRDR